MYDSYYIFNNYHIIYHIYYFCIAKSDSTADFPGIMVAMSDKLFLFFILNIFLLIFEMFTYTYY